MAEKEIKKILVRVPNWIGDAVMCLPALSRLNSLYKNGDITVLAKTKVVPIFLNNPDVKAIIEYDDKAAHRGLKGRFRLSGEIKEKGFDLAILFQNSFDAAFLAFLSRIPERAGYARDLRGGLLTRPIPVSKEIKKKHQACYYLNIIDALGPAGTNGSPTPRIYLSGDEKAWAEEFLKKNGLRDAVLAGVAPGASYGPAKRWAPESYAGVLTELSKHYGAVPIIFGGGEDAEVCKRVSEGVRVKHLNLAGSVSLRQSMSLLENLKVFITNDSGPMHISAALGVPTVAIFGSTDPTLTGPLGEYTKVITKNAECSPCFDRACRFKHYKCLTSIEPQEVYASAEVFIKGR